VDNNCQLLRVLLKLLETSRDSTTLAVGCQDLAQFVSHVSHGGCWGLTFASSTMSQPSLGTVHPA
jgi:hypothetical protein